MNAAFNDESWEQRCTVPVADIKREWSDLSWLWKRQEGKRNCDFGGYTLHLSDSDYWSLNDCGFCPFYGGVSIMATLCMYIERRTTATTTTWWNGFMWYFPPLPLHEEITSGHLCSDDQTLTYNHLQISQLERVYWKSKDSLCLYTSKIVYVYIDRGEKRDRAVERLQAWEVLSNNVTLSAERCGGQRSVCLESPQSV